MFAKMASVYILIIAIKAIIESCYQSASGCQFHGMLYLVLYVVASLLLWND